MTDLLISVRNAEEARLVSQIPAVRIVDVKEPELGSLGRAKLPVLREIAETVSANRCLSFAMGELEEISCTQNTMDVELLARFRYAKIGLANMARHSKWRQIWQSQLELLPPSLGRVGVTYVDFRTCGAPSIESVVEASVNASCEVVLLDTYSKSIGNILDFVSELQLRTILDQIRGCGLKSVVAGSLNLGCLKAVVRCKPDLIGVRGAVCNGSRRGAIDKDKLIEFVNGLNSIRGLNYPPLISDDY